MLMHQISGYNLPQQQAFVPATQSGWPGSINRGANAFSYRFQPLTSGAANTGTNFAGYQPISNAFNATGGMGNFNQIGVQPGYNQSFAPNISSGTAANLTGGTVSYARNKFGMTQPGIDISETKNDIVLACDLPNVNLNDLNLSVSENSCTISAQSWVEGQNLALHRTVPLSTSIRADAVDANYSNGILEVRMPKRDAVSRKEINVNMSQ